jgi:hypothetical protein
MLQPSSASWMKMTIPFKGSYACGLAANTDNTTFKKITNITERVKLDLRLDFFNLFNRVNLTGVNGDAASGSTFGTSTSTQIPRQGQVGARLEF